MAVFEIKNTPSKHRANLIKGYFKKALDFVHLTGSFFYMFNRFIGTGVVLSTPFCKQTKAGLDCLSVKIGFFSERLGKVESLDFECELFGKQASEIANTIKQCMLVVVDGELRNNTWTDTSGMSKSKIRLYANKIMKLEGKAPEQITSGISANKSGEPSKIKGVQNLFDTIEEDDVPF